MFNFPQSVKQLGPHYIPFITSADRDAIFVIFELNEDFDMEKTYFIQAMTYWGIVSSKTCLLQTLL